MLESFEINLHMFITACVLLFILKIRFPKGKSIADILTSLI